MVKGKTKDGVSEIEEYGLNIIYWNKDLTIGNELKSGEEVVSIPGLTSGNGTLWTCGNTGDIGKNTVVLKVEGDLTIETGKTLTSIGDAGSQPKGKIDQGNGPKGMIIYCNGCLTNNGTISMTGKGSRAIGQNVYLFKNADESFEYIPKVGGNAGAANAVGGRATIKRGLAGGGGSNGYSISNPGTAGTSWGSGAGGGSVNIFLEEVPENLSYNNITATEGAAGKSYYRTAQAGGRGWCNCGVVGSGSYVSLYEN